MRKPLCYWPADWKDWRKPTLRRCHLQGFAVQTGVTCLLSAWLLVGYSEILGLFVDKTNRA